MSAALFTLAYFCLITKYGFGLFYHPLFSVFLIFILSLTEFFLNKKKEGVFHPSLSSFSIFIIFYYTGYLIIYFFDYYPEHLLAAISPLFGFTLFFILQFWNRRMIRYLSGALIYFTLGYLLTLYAIRGLPLSYFGLFLIVFGLLIGFLGVYLQKRKLLTLKMASAFYWIGLTVSIISFFYAFFNSTAMLFTISFFVAGCFTLSQLIKKIPLEDTGAEGEEEEPFQESIVMALFNGAHIVSYLYLLLLFYYNFPLSFSVILSSLFLSITLFVMGLHVKELVLVKRSQYIYLFGILLSVSYLVALLKFNPLGDFAYNMVLTIPLFLLFLYFYSFYQKKAQEVFALSFSEVGYFLTILVFSLPILNNEHEIYISSGLIILLLFIYLGVILSNNYYNLFFSFPIFFSALFYNLFKGLGVNDPEIGILFVCPGILAMLLGIYFQKKRTLLSNILFFTWVLISAISFVLTLNFRDFNLYCLAIWGASYLFGSSFILSEQITKSAEA
jgi:hypothetical protein